MISMATIHLTTTVTTHGRCHPIAAHLLANAMGLFFFSFYRVRDMYASRALVVVIKMFLDNYIYITIKLNNKCKLLNINNINNIIYIYSSP